MSNCSSAAFTTGAMRYDYLSLLGFFGYMMSPRALGAEITYVLKLGSWLLLEDDELFVAFSKFPWFADAHIRQLMNVELPQPNHLYWPELDVDLAVESIRNPAAFPLFAHR